MLKRRPCTESLSLAWASGVFGDSIDVYFNCEAKQYIQDDLWTWWRCVHLCLFKSIVTFTRHARAALSSTTCIVLELLQVDPLLHVLDRVDVLLRNFSSACQRKTYSEFDKNWDFGWLLSSINLPLKISISSSWALCPDDEFERKKEFLIVKIRFVNLFLSCCLWYLTWAFDNYRVKWSLNVPFNESQYIARTDRDPRAQVNLIIF